MANEKKEYEKISVLLAKDEPWNYSFELEAERGTEDQKKAIEEEYKTKDPIERYFIYKSTDSKHLGSYFDGCERIVKQNIDKYGDIPDCDSGELATELYKVLWNGSISGDAASFLGELGGDTMNGVQKGLMPCMIKYLISTKEIYKEKSYYYDKNNKKRQVRPDSTSFCIELYSYQVNAKDGNLPEIDFISDLINNFDGIKEYMASYHTLGNFILVPAGFNRKRSSMFNDFWDLSLMYLKQQENDCIWLSKSNLFTKYINYFFLWDYVVCDDKKSEYYVKSMLSDSFISVNEYRNTVVVSPDRPMPNEIEEIKTFIKNAQWTAKRRGIFMTAMLRLQSEIGDKYDELRKKVFAADKCYSGYDEVFREISKEIDLPKIVKDTFSSIDTEK